MDSFDSYLRKFVNTERIYKPQINVIAAGGGVSLAQLLMVPGSSAYVGGMEFPYEQSVVTELLDSHSSKFAKAYAEKAVSAEVACGLAEIAKRKSPMNVGIGITAALTTNRYRRGDNHAYICMSTADYNIERIVHVKFEKLPETLHADDRQVWRDAYIHDKRITEDRTIAMLALALAFGFEVEHYHTMKNSGMLEEVDFHDN